VDYLREGFPWPAKPFKHTESNSFKHTVITFKYMNWHFILPPGPRGLARPPQIYMSLPATAPDSPARLARLWHPAPTPGVFQTGVLAEISTGCMAIFRKKHMLNMLGKP